MAQPRREDANPRTSLQIASLIEPSEIPGLGLSEALLALARDEPSALGAFLQDVEVNTTIEGTLVTTHCHSVALDAHGRPRVADLAEAVRDRVLDYAIPRSRIREAFEKRARTGSSAAIVRLQQEALSLFTDLEKSGEGGELLLFVLAETLLRLPQVMCKMSLKTNRRMHVHGADGVHASADPETGRLALYLGESKIYGDPVKAIRDCLASLAPMLTETGPSAASRRDLQLLERAADLDDPILEATIRRFLDPEDRAFNELEFRGLCLVGFDSAAYPTGISRLRSADHINKILSELPIWKEQIARRIRAEQIEGFALHVICVPFPSAKAFRRYMREVLGVTRAAA